MKTLKEEVLNKEEPIGITWIRIHNRRFIIQNIIQYAMYTSGESRTLDITLLNGKDLAIKFRKEERDEARRTMKVLDVFFNPEDFNEEESNYF
jgi:hypothetical protein